MGKIELSCVCDCGRSLFAKIEESYSGKPDLIIGIKDTSSLFKRIWRAIKNKEQSAILKYENFVALDAFVHDDYVERHNAWIKKIGGR